MYLFLDLLALPLYPCHLGLDPYPILSITQASLARAESG